MKKFFVTLGLAILVLTGCSQSQTKKTTTASSSSSSSVKKEVKNEEKTTTLVGDINGTKHRDIIKSKGDKVENLRIEVTADLPQQLGTIAAEKSPDLKNMKADALVKALKLHGMKEEGQ